MLFKFFALFKFPFRFGMYSIRDGSTAVYVLHTVGERQDKGPYPTECV